MNAIYAGSYIVSIKIIKWKKEVEDQLYKYVYAILSNGRAIAINYLARFINSS